MKLFFLEFLQEGLMETVFPKFWQVKMLLCCLYTWIMIWWGIMFLDIFENFFILALPFSSFILLDRGLRPVWILHSFHVFISNYTHNKNILWAINLVFIIYWTFPMSTLLYKHQEIQLLWSPAGFYYNMAGHWLLYQYYLA